jgi:sec-independent protein translocase protein TatA
MFGGIGIPEILLILLILLLLFGARRLPEIAKGLGKSVKEFKKGMKDVEEDVKKEDDSNKKNLAG